MFVDLGALKIKIKAEGHEDVKKAYNEMSVEANSLKATQLKLQSSIQSLSSELAKQSGKLEASKQKLEAMEAAGKGNSKTAEKLRNEIKSLTDSISRGENKLNSFNQELLETKNNADDMADELNKTAKASKNMGDSADAANKKIANASSSIKNGIGFIKAAVTGYAGKKLYDVLIGTNADYEQKLTSLEVLLQSAEKAETMMENLNKFGAETPFELPEITNATTQLLAFGTAEEEVMTKLQQLGDLSMGNAEKLDRLTNAYGKMLAKGKVSLEELNMFTEAGVPILRQLGEQLNMTDEQLFKAISSGQVSVENIDAAMQKLTSSGGQFFGMMEKQSQAFEGMMSTMSDNATNFAREVGEESFNYLKSEFEGLMDLINEMSESGELNEIAQDIGGDIANTVMIIGSLLKSLYEMKDLIIAGAGAVVTYKVAFSTLNTAFAVGNTIRELYNILSGKTVICTNLETGATVKLTATEYAEAKAKGVAVKQQTLFNAALNANPIMAVISLVAALTGAIITYSKVCGDAKDETANLSQEYLDNIAAIDKQAEREQASAVKAEQLRKRLFELDEALRSNTLSTNEEITSKQQLKTVVNELNELIPNLNLQIDDETGYLVTQKGEVIALTDAFINLTKAKAFAAAYQSKIDEATKTIVEAEEIMNNTPEKEVVMKFNSPSEWGTYGLMSERVVETAEYKDARIAKERAEADMGGFIAELSKWKNETDKYNADGNDLNGNGTTGGVGTNANKAKTKDKKDKADFLKIYKDYINADIKEAERQYKNRAKIMDMTAEDEALAIEERIKIYQAYNSEILADTRLTEAEKAELIDENNKEIEDLLADSYEIRRKEFKKQAEEQKKEIEGLYSEIVSKYKGLTNDLQNNIKSLRTKLKGEISLFEKQTVTVKGGNLETGVDASYNKYSLTNFSQTISKLNEYKSALEKVKGRGNIPQGFFSELRNLSIDDAIGFCNELLKLSDSDLTDYTYGWSEVERMTGSIATSLYSTEIANLQTSWEGAISSMLADTPQEFFEAGKLCLQKFEEGLGMSIKDVNNIISNDKDGDGRNDVTKVEVKQNFYTPTATPSQVKKAAEQGVQYAQTIS